MDNQPMLTPFQMELLSNIFRVMIKEIVTDEDKEKLAPGEMGINYKEGSFYIRNPHTGELFTPNSLSHLNQMHFFHTFEYINHQQLYLLLSLEQTSMIL